MAFAVDLAVSPTIGPDGLTHPTLVLWSDGRITATNGAGVPQKATADDIYPQLPTGGGWSSPRYNGFVSPTTGLPSGEIAKKIVVIPTGGWTDLTNIKGYILDAWGQRIPFGTTTLPYGTTPYWGPATPGGTGQNIARDLAINNDGSQGYVLDYFGGVHPTGTSLPDPMAVYPYWPGYDLGRAIVLNPNFAAAPGPHGFVLDAYGGMHRISVNVGDAWLGQTTNGGGYWAGWDIARDMVYNFTTNYGYQMNGWGDAFAMGTNHAELGTMSQGHAVPGGPHTEGADIWTAMSWPDVAVRYFVTLNRNGAAHPWNMFVVPALAFTSPPTTLTNTSRPAITFTYGVGQNPAPSPMTDVGIWIYPLTVTQQTGFREDQGFGAVFSYYAPGVTGVNAGGSFSVTMADDLQDSTQYKVYVTATSTDGVSSGWVSRAFTTAFNRPAAPTLSGTNQNNNATGARNSLTATGSGTFQFQFTDDPTEVLWYDVAGASATTSANVFDYDAIFQRSRKYRVYKVTPSPYLRSNASNKITLTFALPTAGGSWSFSTISSTPTVVNIRAAAWTKTLRSLSEVHYPATALKGVVLSGGVYGIQGTLEIWLTDPTNPTGTASRDKHDALMELLNTAQVLKLQNPGGEQWYVWPGDVSFELLKTPINNFIYKATAQLTEVERPLVVT